MVLTERESARPYAELGEGVLPVIFHLPSSSTLIKVLSSTLQVSFLKSVL